jgi:hypothetical protein
VVIMQFPGSSSSAGAASPGAGTGASSSGTSITGGSGSAYDAMMATPYGAQAAQDAAAAGINVDAMAAIGMAESNFQNVPTANGTSSATGPWQMTTGTFMQYSNANMRAGGVGLRQTRAFFRPADDAARPCCSWRASTALARRQRRG